MPKTSYSILVATVLGIASVLSAAEASAQATLSVEETKQCLLAERELERQRLSLGERQPALARQETELARLKQRVEEAQSRVFLGAVPDPAARTEYETLRDLQYREFDMHAERLREYNDDVTRYNQDLVAYNADCSGNRFTDYNLRLARQQLGWE